MAGVPYHAGEVYIARLIGAGHRVAVCEQVEDGGGLGQWRPPKDERPARAGDDGPRGDARRHPRDGGRAADAGGPAQQLLRPHRGGCPGRRAVRGLRFGLAQADLTTGEFAATELSGEEAEADWSGSSTACARRSASSPPLDGAPSGTEQPGLRGATPAGRPGQRAVAATNVTPTFRPWRFELWPRRRAALPALRREQPGRLRLRPPPLATRAAGALVAYVEQTHRPLLALLDGLHT